MSGEWIYWLGWLAALAVYTGMVYLAWRALYRDRANGRRRCPRCWYDLAYSPGMTCGECGFTGQNERQFFRTRRHYGQAAAAIGVCVVIVLLGNQYLRQASWYSLMPTRVLIAALPIADEDNSRLIREIGLRLRGDQLSNRERRLLVNRLVAGSWGTRPLSDSWQRKYGGVIESLRLGLARERGEDGAYTELETLLLDLPAEVLLTSRDVWPLDAAPMVQMRLRDWWPTGTNLRAHIAPRLEGAEPIVVTRSSRRRAWSDFPLPLPRLEESLDSVVFDVKVERRRSGTDDDWIESGNETITVPLRREGMLADILEPVEDEDLTSAIRGTFRNGVVLWSNGPAPLRVYFTPQQTHSRQFDDIAIGAHVDVLRDGEIVRRLDIWWLAGDVDTERGVAYSATEYDREVLSEINEEDGRWMMRVTGDPALALRPGNASKYWSGSFTVPLKVTFSDNRAPPRWWSTLQDTEADEDGDP
ncbi:MAG: hypothetical protein ACYTGG_12530 [Planctomycetota bacterium]|jgi:hypothetical protein